MVAYEAREDGRARFVEPADVGELRVDRAACLGTRGFEERRCGCTWRCERVTKQCCSLKGILPSRNLIPKGPVQGAVPGRWRSGAWQGPLELGLSVTDKVAARALCGAAPPASRALAPLASLRDRLRRPLTPEPLRPLAGRKSGQGRALPAGRAARDLVSPCESHGPRQERRRRG